MRKQRLQYWILAGDIACALLALPLAYLMRYGFHWYGPTGDSFLTFVPPLLVATGLWVVIFSWMPLDGFRLGWHLSAVLSQLFVALCFLMLILMAGGYLLQVYVSRLTLFYFGMLLFIGFSSTRCLAHAVLGSKYFARTVRRVLIVGNGAVAREMATKIQRHPEMLCKVVGFLYPADTSVDPRIPGITEEARTVQTLALVDLLREKGVEEVIITLPSPGSPEVINLSSRCRREGIGVSIVPHPYELYLSKPQLLDIGGLPILQLREPKANLASAVLKRSFDLVASLCLMVLSAPIVAIGGIALVGRKGGPFVRELRCGQFGNRFQMCRLNSDRDAQDVPRFERFLQLLSVTEMPQLWNVIRGEMSLVGPRPESPERVKHYSEWQRQRLNVKPGMTGLAQVFGLREQHSSEEKTRFDLQYMMHASLFFDISLMLQTGWTLIARLFHLYELRSREMTPTSEGGIDPSMERILVRADSTQSSAD